MRYSYRVKRKIGEPSEPSEPRARYLRARFFFSPYSRVGSLFTGNGLAHTNLSRFPLGARPDHAFELGGTCITINNCLLLSLSFFTAGDQISTSGPPLKLRETYTGVVGGGSPIITGHKSDNGATFCTLQ